MILFEKMMEKCKGEDAGLKELRPEKLFDNDIRITRPKCAITFFPPLRISILLPIPEGIASVRGPAGLEISNPSSRVSLCGGRADRMRKGNGLRHRWLIFSKAWRKLQRVRLPLFVSFARFLRIRQT